MVCSWSNKKIAAMNEVGDHPWINMQAAGLTNCESLCVPSLAYRTNIGGKSLPKSDWWYEQNDHVLQLCKVSIAGSAHVCSTSAFSCQGEAACLQGSTYIKLKHWVCHGQQVWRNDDWKEAHPCILELSKRSSAKSGRALLSGTLSSRGLELADAPGLFLQSRLTSLNTPIEWCGALYFEKLSQYVTVQALALWTTGM